MGKRTIDKKEKLSSAISKLNSNAQQFEVARETENNLVSKVET